MPKTELSPPINPNLPSHYQSALEQLTPLMALTPSTVIYYPACGVDLSVYKAFPSHRVIHIDNDVSSISILQSLGIEASQANATLAQPIANQPVDLMVLLNPDNLLNPASLCRVVAIGGYVVTNNWKGTTDALRAHPDFKHLADVKTVETLSLFQRVQNTDLPEDPSPENDQLLAEADHDLKDVPLTGLSIDDLLQ